MIDCPVVVTVCQSDSYHDRLRQVGRREAAYFNLRTRGQDTWSRGAGAGSRGVVDDCCVRAAGVAHPARPH